MLKIIQFLVPFLILLFLPSCFHQIPSVLESQEVQSTQTETIQLPPPSTIGKISLEEALSRRRSLRQFRDAELSWQEVGQLLWATQGITSPEGKRTAPSAGALYPLEIYYFFSAGWGKYLPETHSLQLFGQKDRREELASAAYGQMWIAQAPSIFLVAGKVEKTATKYGHKAERYVILEAGHATQNLLLQATALDMGGTSVGAFDEQKIKEIVGEDILYLYLVPVGYPQK